MVVSFSFSQLGIRTLIIQCYGVDLLFSTTEKNNKPYTSFLKYVIGSEKRGQTPKSDFEKKNYLRSFLEQT